MLHIAPGNLRLAHPATHFTKSWYKILTTCDQVGKLTAFKCAVRHDAAAGFMESFEQVVCWFSNSADDYCHSSLDGELKGRCSRLRFTGMSHKGSPTVDIDDPAVQAACATILHELLSSGSWEDWPPSPSECPGHTDRAETDPDVASGACGSRAVDVRVETVPPPPWIRNLGISRGFLRFRIHSPVAAQRKSRATLCLSVPWPGDATRCRISARCDPSKRPSAVLCKRMRANYLTPETMGVVNPNRSFCMHIHCPHCRSPIEVVDEQELRDVTCPSCGSSFNLLPDETVTRIAKEQKTLGHFELMDRIGVGAFGEVWTAHDSELDRTVAIKLPRKGQLSAEEAESFLREARSAARLNHPGIVAVHEVGKVDDQLFIVSDYVRGVTLADWLTANRPTPKEAAELVAQLADAVQHAHEHGVIHRDLKPSNIMLDDTGQPHIMDFGLAKRDAGEITMTLEGKILGTPAYMSPEQAKGAAHDADAQ